MPKPKKGARLGGSPAHQRLILSNLATALFEQGRITTTETKARMLRPVAEKLITKAKRGDLHNRREVLKTIRDKATASVAADSAGNRVLSPAALDKAIRELDADGKLTLIFGRQGAQFMRDLNELAQIAKTVPPESGVNYSNTSSALLAALGDAGVMSMTGAPVPLVTLGRFVSRHVKDQALKKRIQDALNNPLPVKAPGRRGSTTPEQFPGATATVH